MGIEARVIDGIGLREKGADLFTENKSVPLLSAFPGFRRVTSGSVADGCVCSPAIAELSYCLGQ